ncbi:MAG TPA: protein kinase [Gammaproteobacteria bacterium]
MSEHSHIQELSNRVYGQTARPGGGARPTRATDDGTAENARRIAGRYRLSERIGRGRLGDIYEAVDETSGDLGVERRVAIQLLDPKIVAKKSAKDELKRAYAALRAGPHVNVVDILDFGTDDDVPFVVMELLEGASLRFVLDDVTVLSTDEALAVIRAVGDALQYLHAKGLVYGPLKPENVIITFEYGIKLLDIAPASLPSGVPYYVEETDSRASARDARDDVLSLACLTYELLSGKHPFNSNSPLEAQRADLKPLPISGLAPGQWRAIAAGLELQRGLRTSTIDEFLNDLGVRRIEKLRVPDDDGPPLEPSPPHRPVARPPEYTFLNPPAPRAADPEYVSRPQPRRVADYYPRQHHARAEPDDAAPLRTARKVLAAAVVGGLGALAFTYAPLREGALDLMVARDGSDDRAAAAPSATATMPAVPDDQGRSAAVELGIDAPSDPVHGEPVPTAVTTPETSAAEAPPTVPVDEPAPAAEDGSLVPGTEQARDTTATTAGAASGEPPAEPVDLPATVAALSPSASAVAVDASSRAPSEPPFAFAAAAVTVGEHEVAAVVVVNRVGDAARPASVVWWTSDDSAIADEDYADLGQRTEDFAPGEQSRSLYIPLIDDTLRERRESYYVYLGDYDPGQRSLRAYSVTRVDIADDD